MRQIVFLFIIILLIPTSFASANSADAKKYRIEDVEQVNVPEVMSNISPSDEVIVDVGDYFDTAIKIPMSVGTNDVLRTGSISTELNSTTGELFFKYDITDTGLVSVELNSAVSTDTYIMFLDLFMAPNEWTIGGSSDEGPFPMVRDYMSPGPGERYLLVSGFNKNSGYLKPGDSIPFTITVNQLKQGIAPTGGSSNIISSEPFNTMDAIATFFEEKGYIQNGTLNLDTKGFGANSPTYYQGIASSIYGVIRAGNAKANAGKLDPIQRDLILADYIDLALDLLNDAVVTHGNLAYFGGGAVDPLFFRTGTTDLFLIDNIYMIMAISEILFEAVRGGPTTKGLTDYTLIADLMVNLSNSLAHFNTTAGRFFETLDRTQYLSSVDQRGNRIYLESLALMVEVMQEINAVSFNIQGDVLFAPSVTLGSFDIPSIITEIDTNLFISTVDGYSLTNAGIGVEWWDSGTGLKANTSSLMGNLFYALNLNSQFLPQESANLALNILRLFTSSSTGLLYSNIEVDAFGTVDFPKRISTFENSHAILLMQRLQNKFDAIDEDISRSWGRKSITLLENMNAYLFDDVDKVYFGMYDDEAQVLIAKPNDARSNRFVANAFINTILVRIFPAEVTVNYNEETFVDEMVGIEFEFSQIFLSDTANWWDFLVPLSFQATLTIDAFNLKETVTVDTNDFFDFSGSGVGNSKFIPYFYTPTEKGNYTINLKLSSEGRVLLDHSFTATAFGEVFADFIGQQLEFSTDDTEFDAEFSLVDNKGIQIPNLRVNASLGRPFLKANDSKYIKSARSDSSGKISLSFDVSDVEKDNIVTRNENRQQFTYIVLNINITNAKTFNLRQVEAVIKLEIRVTLARIFPSVSPSLLEITQGTTDSFSFSVNVLNQVFDPINLATITYSIDGVPGSSNVVTTDSDGEATITFRDQDLFGLSDLAIIKGGKTNTTIRMLIEHSDYPDKTIFKFITILPNSIKITANPVQFITQEKAFFEPAKSSIDVEVATEDLFGRSIAAFVSVDWADPANVAYFDIVAANGENRIAPATFSIDPSNLVPGEYLLEIKAEKSGLTSTSQAGALGLSQEVNKPVVSVKRIIVEENNLEEVLLSGIALYGALFISKFLGVLQGRVSRIIGRKIECPLCGEPTSKNKPVCSNCGRDLPKKGSKEKSNQQEEDVSAK